MLDRRLGQTFIVEPEVPFAEIDSTLRAMGWQQQDRPLSPAPLITGEPEAASWSWQGQKPFIIYTFNPVARLRVLDVATLPPVFRKGVVNALPILKQRDVDHLFFADEPRNRLLGLWAAQETERIDLLLQAERLCRDGDREVAQQAEPVARRLKRISQARLETFAQLQILVRAAPDLIRRFDDPVFVAALKPSLDDCKLLFDERMAEAACVAAGQWYEPGFRLHRISRDAEITVTAAPAGLLRWSNELSEKFPGGYRDIAGWMSPKSLWLTWKIQEPKGSSVRYDGLAWLGDRWVWLPKIYRALAPLCFSGRAAQPQTH